MAQQFNLTAQLQLQAPTNTNQVINQIRKQLKPIGVQVKIQNARNLSQANSALSSLNKNAQASKRSVNDLNRTLQESARRFSVITLATGSLLALANGFKNAVRGAVDFERELIKISQVTGRTTAGLQGLTQEITRLSTSLGASSSELLGVAKILSQAGFAAADTRRALDILAKTTLGSTFDNIQQTTEGAIALLRQFSVEAQRSGGNIAFLEKSLDAINSVSKSFAVESGDLITAIRRVGGVFSAAGGSVNELIALFTSVRATTRESAETIATGLRTIFTRIQRTETIDQLKRLNIELSDSSGNFVGAYKAVERLSQGLAGLDPRSGTFSQIVEELGGFRQVGKVIPLIQQFATAQNALNVAQSASGSVSRDAIKAQQGLGVQIAKVREQFDALIRKFSDTATFNTIATGALRLAEAFIKIADSMERLLPLIAAFTFAKLGKGLAPAVGGVLGIGRRAASGGSVSRFASGGLVPGSGNSDTVPAMLTPGEFVIKKSSVNSIGVGNLARMNNNRYADGGKAKEKISSLGPLVKSEINKRGFKKIHGSDTITVPIKDTVISAQRVQNISKANKDAATLIKNQGKGTGVKRGPLWEKVASAILRKSLPDGNNNRPLDSKNVDYKYKPKSTAIIANEIARKRLQDSLGINGGFQTDKGVLNRYTEIRGENQDARGVEIVRPGWNISNPNSFANNVKKRATGGGISGSDTVPALLTPGEFVFSKSSAQSIGYSNLNRMNKHGVRGYASGGIVQGFNEGGRASAGGTLRGIQGVAQASQSMIFLAGTVSAVATQFLELEDAQSKTVTELIGRYTILTAALGTFVDILTSTLLLFKLNKKSENEETIANKAAAASEYDKIRANKAGVASSGASAAGSVTGSAAGSAAGTGLFAKLGNFFKGITKVRLGLVGLATTILTVAGTFIYFDYLKTQLQNLADAAKSAADAQNQEFESGKSTTSGRSSAIQQAESIVDLQAKSAESTISYMRQGIIGVLSTAGALGGAALAGGATFGAGSAAGGIGGGAAGYAAGSKLADYLFGEKEQQILRQRDQALARQITVLNNLYDSYESVISASNSLKEQFSNFASQGLQGGALASARISAVGESGLTTLARQQAQSSSLILQQFLASSNLSDRAFGLDDLEAGKIVSEGGFTELDQQGFQKAQQNLQQALEQLSFAVNETLQTLDIAQKDAFAQGQTISGQRIRELFSGIAKPTTEYERALVQAKIAQVEEYKAKKANLQLELLDAKIKQENLKAKVDEGTATRTEISQLEIYNGLISNLNSQISALSPGIAQLANNTETANKVVIAENRSRIVALRAQQQYAAKVIQTARVMQSFQEEIQDLDLQGQLFDNLKTARGGGLVRGNVVKLTESDISKIANPARFASELARIVAGAQDARVTSAGREALQVVEILQNAQKVLVGKEFTGTNNKIDAKNLLIQLGIDKLISPDQLEALVNEIVNVAADGLDPQEFSQLFAKLFEGAQQQVDGVVKAATEKSEKFLDNYNKYLDNLIEKQDREVKARERFVDALDQFDDIRNRLTQQVARDRGVEIAPDIGRSRFIREQAEARANLRTRGLDPNFAGNVQALGATRSFLENRRDDLTAKLNQKRTQEEQRKTAEELAKTQMRLEGVNQELERLRTSTTGIDMLFNAMGRNSELIDRERSKRETLIGVLEDAITGGAEGRQNLYRNQAMSTRAIQMGTLQGFAPEDQKQIVTFLRSLGDEIPVAFGKSGKQLADELIARDVFRDPFINPAFKQALATTITSEEKLIQANLLLASKIDGLAQVMVQAADPRVVGFSQGGPVYRATGGAIGSIFKPKGTDTIPAMLSEGEYVLQKSAVDKYGTQALDDMNKGRGFVSGPRMSSGGGNGKSAAQNFEDGGLAAQLKKYLVSEGVSNQEADELVSAIQGMSRPQLTRSLFSTGPQGLQELLSRKNAEAYYRSDQYRFDRATDTLQQEFANTLGVIDPTGITGGLNAAVLSARGLAGRRSGLNVDQDESLTNQAAMQAAFAALGPDFFYSSAQMGMRLGKGVRGGGNFKGFGAFPKDRSFQLTSSKTTRSIGAGFETASEIIDDFFRPNRGEQLVNSVSRRRPQPPLLELNSAGRLIENQTGLFANLDEVYNNLWRNGSPSSYINADPYGYAIGDQFFRGNRTQTLLDAIEASRGYSGKTDKFFQAIEGAYWMEPSANSGLSLSRWRGTPPLGNSQLLPKPKAPPLIPRRSFLGEGADPRWNTFGPDVPPELFDLAVSDFVGQGSRVAQGLTGAAPVSESAITGLLATGREIPEAMAKQDPVLKAVKNFMDRATRSVSVSDESLMAQAIEVARKAIKANPNSSRVGKVLLNSLEGAKKIPPFLMGFAEDAYKFSGKAISSTYAKTAPLVAKYFPSLYRPVGNALLRMDELESGGYGQLSDGTLDPTYTTSLSLLEKAFDESKALQNIDQNITSFESIASLQGKDGPVVPDLAKYMEQAKDMAEQRYAKFKEGIKNPTRIGDQEGFLKNYDFFSNYQQAGAPQLGPKAIKNISEADSDVRLIDGLSSMYLQRMFQADTATEAFEKYLREAGYFTARAGQKALTAAKREQDLAQEFSDEKIKQKDSTAETSYRRFESMMSVKASSGDYGNYIDTIFPTPFVMDGWEDMRYPQFSISGQGVKNRSKEDIFEFFKEMSDNLGGNHKILENFETTKGVVDSPEAKDFLLGRKATIASAGLNAPQFANLRAIAVGSRAGTLADGLYDEYFDTKKLPTDDEFDSEYSTRAYARWDSKLPYAVYNGMSGNFQNRDYTFNLLDQAGRNLGVPFANWTPLMKEVGKNRWNQMAINKNNQDKRFFNAPIYRAKGGKIPLYLNKGGAGDNVPAMLTAGEYVMKKEAVNRLGVGYLDKLNQGVEVQGFNRGGRVTRKDRLDNINKNRQEIFERRHPHLGQAVQQQQQPKPAQKPGVMVPNQMQNQGVNQAAQGAMAAMTQNINKLVESSMGLIALFQGNGVFQQALTGITKNHQEILTISQSISKAAVTLSHSTGNLATAIKEGIKLEMEDVNVSVDGNITLDQNVISGLSEAIGNKIIDEAAPAIIQAAITAIRESGAG